MSVKRSSRVIYNLPPELWEYIITEYHLLDKKYIETIKMIPYKHCIMETVYNVIQQYMDYMCTLFYSINNNFIDKPHIFNKENLFNIYKYLTNNITVDSYPTISGNDYIILVKLNNKTVKIFKTIINETCILYFLDNKLHRTNEPAYIIWSNNGDKLYDIYYINGHCHHIPLNCL